ncbi:MAG: hypothetical protein RMH84_03810, partial [Sulfolobales archaeon]|nr:hypothetical protein [Sulfolobales archaeon]
FLLLLSSYAISVHRGEFTFFYYAIPLALLLFITLPLVLELLSYSSYVKNLREDIAYFMVVDGVCPGDDLIRDLEEDSDTICSFLPALCSESSRLRLFMKFFPGTRGIREYVLRAPKPMKKLLLEYVVTRESAGFGNWIYGKFQDSLREIKVSTRNSLELKTILSLTTVVFSGLAPSLIALTALVSGQEVLYLYPITTLPAIAMAISESSVPRVLRLPSGSGRIKTVAALLPLSLTLYPVLGLKNSVAIAGLVFLSFGVVVSAELVRAYLELVSLPSQIAVLADKLPYSNKPIELVRESLGRALGKSIFTSICYYMLLKAVKGGGIDSAKIMAFKDVVEELFSLLKQSAVVRALVLATAILLPLISAYSISLAESVNSATGVLYTYCFTSSLFYSAVATLAVFGSLENTLLLGLVMIELYVLGVTP